MSFDLERARADLDAVNMPADGYYDTNARIVKIHMPSALAEIERLRANLLEYQNVIDDAKNLEEQIEIMHLRRDNELRQMNELSLKNKDLTQEIERLRARVDTARMEERDRWVHDYNQQAAQIRELEDAHKRSGAKYAKIINELRLSVYANIPGLKKQWDDIQNVPANGKIGPDADAKPHCWQITEERVEALGHVCSCLDFFYIPAKTDEVLRAMLEEAGV